MPSIYTEIEINAPRSLVWQVLTQKQDWLKWNTFLYDRDPKKPIEPGRTIFLSLKRAAGEEETEFEPRITLLQPEVCLHWYYSAPGFQSEHRFELQDVGWNYTKYIHRENFSGIFVRLFFPFIRQDEQQGMKRMARELKQYAEGHRRR